METLSTDYAIFYGKVGADNLLLMLVGVLFFVLYALKRQEAHYDRLKIYLCSGLFFVFYGFSCDLYRLKFLRPFLLSNFSFQPYRTLILLASLLPLYFYLIESIVKILKARYMPRK